MTHIRASAVASWAACEVMALHSPIIESRTHVAQWVGTAAHALLATGELPAAPDQMRFDRTTQSHEQAVRHARWCAREAQAVIDAEGWWQMEAEVDVRGPDTVGTYDLLLGNDDGALAIVDLKTGWNPGAAAWLQVGAYLSICDVAGVTLGGILHSPREAHGARGKGSLTVRGSAGLIEAWQDRRQRITEVLNGAKALATPGQHCVRCGVAGCAIRANNN